jgi:hypothetical protein
MGWMIDIRGAQFREEQVTGAHLTVVNAFLGVDDWSAVDPMSSPTALMMWAAVAVSEMTKQPLDETVLMVQQVPLSELLGCYTPEAAPAAPASTQGPMPPIPQPVPAFSQ